MIRHYCDSCGCQMPEEEGRSLYNYYISYPYTPLKPTEMFSCSLCEMCYVLVTEIATRAVQSKNGGTK